MKPAPIPGVGDLASTGPRRTGDLIGIGTLRTGDLDAGIPIIGDLAGVVVNRAVDRGRMTGLVVLEIN